MNAVVLCGGGLLGAVEVGLLRAVEEQDVCLDLVVGTSVGAVNGAYVAGGGAAKELAELWRGLRGRDVFRPNLAVLWRGLSVESLCSPAGLRHLLERHLPARRFAGLEVPLVVTATDFATGERIELTTGDLVEAVLASTAIPGIFPPVEGPDGRLLIDGSLSGNVPLEVAADRGADRVFCVLCECCVDRTRIRRSFLGAIAQAHHLLERRASGAPALESRARELGVELVLVEPDVGIPVGDLDLSHISDLLRRGYESSRERLRSLQLAPDEPTPRERPVGRR